MGGKKSSCILLLAAFAAFLRLGSAEGDPLPPSLVDLVRDSPISSIEDLKKVLDTDSVEEESDNQTVNEIHPSEAHHRVPRSLIANAEPAQQAACKVRTEVLEVTRSMHDRTNAHFVLWPPCVEVQRCSGCCSNGRTHECVPVLTEIRQLQMMKITYVNMRPHIEKVIIPVEDHVRCGCQSLPSPHAPRTSTPRRLQPTPPPAPRLARKPAQPPPPRSQNKDDLHRHDVLKHNQRLHLEERDAQDRVWQNKYSLSHTAGEPHHTPVRMDYQAQPQHPPTHTDHHHPPPPPQHPLTHTQPGASPADGEGGLSGQPTSGAQQALGNAGQQEDGRQPTLHHSSGDDNTRQTQGGTQQQQHQQQQQQQHQQPNYKQYHHQYPQHNYRLTVEEQQRYQPTQSGTYMLRDATTPQQPQRGAAYHHGQPDAPVHHRGQPDAPAHHQRQSDMASHPHSQSEGSSHHSGTEGSSSPFDSQPEVTNGPRRQEDTEEEKRRRLHIEELEKEKETQQDVKSVLHQDKHHSHQPQPQSQPQTSTQRAVTDAPTTLQPPSESPRPHTTPRPPPPRRRRRKHRRRLSKATMRAMIMVMS